MPEADWDPDRYARYAADRDAPFWLLASLLEPAERPRLLDLGCGDGRLTGALADRLGAAAVTGVDRSPAMLAAARERVRAVEGDLATWTTDERFDVVVSNAALHWVADHEAVLARWLGFLAPGGQLAVQLPDMRRSAPHRLVDALAGGPTPHTVLDPEVYATVLHDLGVAALHVRSHVHPLELPDAGALVDWLRGSRLTHEEATMAPDRFAALLDDLRAALPPGPVFLPYLRTYLWARV